MMIRKYVVRDMPEALIRIRGELGKDAIILGSKRVRVRKWFLWSSKRIEVTAAVAGDVPVRLVDESRNSPQTAVSWADASNTGVGGSTAPSSVRPQANASMSPASVQAAHLANIAASASESFADSSQTEVGVESDQRLQAALEPILSEMKSLKTWIQTLDGQHRQTGTALFVNELKEAGVSEAVAGMWWDKFTQSHPDPATWNQTLYRGWLKDCVLNVMPSAGISDSSKVVAFVGPTGVGKTTTIAKLAALHVLSGRRKVALVTADTYRIAAAEQLRTYATILNIPMVVADPQKGLDDAVRELDGADLILVDTAGRNYIVPKMVDEMQRLLATTTVDETYLVLAMTSKVCDLANLCAAFEPVGVDKLLFTKLDETSSHGAALELSWKMKIPLSYVTTGQNVPDDLALASTFPFLDEAFKGELP